MTPGERIIKLREDADLKQYELANKINMNPVVLNRIEKGKRPLKDEDAIVIADFFKVTTDYILKGIKTIYQTPLKGIKIPVLGSVVAGMPISAITDIIGYEEITPAMANTGNYFALKIKGDSMLPKLENGDIVIVREQPDIETGEIAIVMVNGDEATVKQVKKINGGIMLYGFNPAVYEPHFYSDDDINKLPVVIVGKVVESRRCW